MNPIPLYFQNIQNNPAPVAWACGKCRVIYGAEARAIHCCDRNRCLYCLSATAPRVGAYCPECAAKRDARQQDAKSKSLEAWRALPDRQPISAYEGTIADLDGGEDTYHTDWEALVEHCLSADIDPRTLRLCATKPTRVTWTAAKLADDLIDDLREMAYEDWGFWDREELERLLEPVAALVNAQDLGYTEDTARPLDFDLPWPPETEEQEP